MIFHARFTSRSVHALLCTLRPALIIVCIPFSITPGAAQVVSTGGVGNWSSGANWQGGNPPANDGTATVLFSAAETVSTIDTPWSIAALQTSAGSYTQLGGSQLTLGSGGISSDYSELHISNSIVLSANQTWASDSGILQTGSVDLNGKTLTVSGTYSPFNGTIALNSGTLILAGNSTGLGSENSLSGTGHLSVTGGIWDLSQNMSNVNASGTVSVSGGSLDLSGATFTGNIDVSGGTLAVDSTFLFSSLTGNGTLKLTGNRALPSSLYGSFTGTFDLQSGTFTPDDTVLQTATWAGTPNATLDFSSATNPFLGGIDGNISLFIPDATTLKVGGNNASTTYSGAVSGGGSLEKIGSGTLTLDGTHTHTGGTTISAGTLALSAGSFTGNITNNGTLEFTNSIGDFATVGSGGGHGQVEVGVTYSGVLSGNGALIRSNAGYAVLTGANTFTGTTTISTGRLVVGHPLALQNSTVTLDGGQLLFYSPGWTIYGTPSGNTYTFRGPYTTTATLGGLAGAGTLSLDLPQPYYHYLDLRAGIELSVGNNHASTTFAGAISGIDGFIGPEYHLNHYAPGSVTKVGTGTLTLTGGSSYYGGTTISGGTLQLGDGGASGSIMGDVINNATLAFNRSDAVTFAYVISGSGHVTKAGSGTLTLSATNTYAGGTTISGGLIEFSALDNFGSGNITLNGGGLKWAGDTTTDVSARLDTILGAGGATFDTNGNSVVLSSAFSGTGGLAKSGTGTLTLSSATTFSGGTTVSAGILALGHSLTLQNSTVTLAGGTLEFGALASATFAGLAGSTDLALINTSSAAVALTVGANHASTTYSAALSGTGSLAKTGNGTLTLTGHNTFSGGTTISAGTLQIGAGGTTGSIAGNIVNHGTLAFNRSDHLEVSGLISGNGNLTTSGAGTLTLSGANTYLGGTTIGSGVVAAGGNSSFGSGPLAFNGGSLQAATGGITLPNAATFNADTTLGGSLALTLSGPLTLTGFKTLTIANTAQTTFSGSIGESSPSLLIKQGSGELQLTGANTYSAGTFIQSGTVRINNSSGSAFGTGAVTIASSATLAGSGSFTGALQLNGTFSPGNSPGTTTTGSQTWAGGTANLIWEINNATGTAGADPGWDLISISGALHIAATSASPFTIYLTSLADSTNGGHAANFNPASNYTFDFVTAAGGITGFDTNAFVLDTTAFTNAFTGIWSIAGTANALSLSYTASAIPEPSTYAALAGLAMLGFAAYRRQRRLVTPKI